MNKANDILNGIYSILSTPNIGTGKTFTRFYKWSYPDSSTDDYFGVINTLQIPTDSAQEVDLNVNVYAKDLSKQKGIPDLATLGTMMDSVIDDLHEYNDGCFDIEYRFMQVLREEKMQRHFFNLRFNLLFISN